MGDLASFSKLGDRLLSSSRMPLARGIQLPAPDLRPAGRDVLQLSATARTASRATTSNAAARTELDLDAVLGAPTVDQARGTLRDFYAATRDQSLPRIPEEADARLGEQGIAEAEQEAAPYTANPGLKQYLQGVVDRVSRANGLPRFDVTLLDDPRTINAFNAGGPTMAVFTGLLPTVRNEAELAGILAHEMTHGIERHVTGKVVVGKVSDTVKAAVGKRYGLSADDLDRLFSIVVDKVAPPDDPEATSVRVVGAKPATGATSAGTNAAADATRDPMDLAPYTPAIMRELAPVLRFAEADDLAVKDLDRAAESEADAGAARLLSKAGYDPHALGDWLSRMPANDASPLAAQLLFEHPSDADRIQALNSEIASEHLDQGLKEQGTERYEQATAAIRRQMEVTPESA